MTRALVLLPASLALLLLLAPVALAGEQEPVSGEGLYGSADDKVVTNAGFIVIAGFALFVLTMSLIMWRLDKRKERRKAAAARLPAHHWDGGW